MQEQINKWMNKESCCKSLVTVIIHWGQSNFCFIDYLYMRDLRIHVVKCVNSCCSKICLNKIPYVNPKKKKTPTKKGCWWTTGLNFKKKEKHKQSLTAISAQDLSCNLQTVLRGEAFFKLNYLPALCPPSEPALIKEFLESHFGQ